MRNNSGMPQPGEQVHPLFRRAKEFASVQKRGEFSRLLWLVQDLRPAVVLEIGTHAGGTLYCWCRLADANATIVSIDLPGGRFGAGYTEERAQEMMSLFPSDGQQLHLLRADSHDPTTVEQLQSILDGRQLDLLFIDGDHTYEGVRRDFEMYSPLAAAGGAIVFHDILDHPRFPACEVRRLWNEVKDDYRHEEITAPPETWGGIGVLWVDAPTGA
jgi:predicted O-methyltransferase YrrM